MTSGSSSGPAGDSGSDEEPFRGHSIRFQEQASRDIDAAMIGIADFLEERGQSNIEA